LNGERLELVRLAALVHDVGKIGVRDDVLLKPDELSPEERAEVERHPIVAAEILRPIRGARDIAEIVLAHHECPDGSGYPKRLTAAQIPLEAHVIRVADVFACLTEKRPYKPAINPTVALEIMEGLAGSKLDAGAFRAFQEMLAVEPQICRDAGLDGKWPRAN
jgi:HD-GYP domain-containing protein (c-di-GMP phosphodiesterase class II)